MTIAIDTNRVGFETLNITQKAEALGLLAPLSDIPTQNAGAYKETPVDVEGEANQENLVDVRNFGIASVPYYRTQAHTNPTYEKNIPGAPDVNYVREGTGRLLKQVNETLDKLGLELVVVDGHRSPVTQNILFKAFKEQYFEKVHCGESFRTPENSDVLDEKRRFYDEKAREFALDFCSSAENFDAKNPKTWSIHSTGGAVDVYMRDKNSGKIVDMGEEYFDNPQPATCMGFYEKQPEAQLSGQQQGYRDARRVLYNVMTSAGFVNYGNECFHFSYQDMYWGCVKGKNAKYGYMQSPKDRSLSLMLGALVDRKTKNI